MVQPWHDKAQATFTTVVDQNNVLASTFGFKAVPNGLLIDPNGVLHFKQIGGFDIHREETRQQVEMFLATHEGKGPETDEPMPTIGSRPAAAGESWEQHYREAVQLMEAGRVREAAVALRRALMLDPSNFLVRKQLWRTLHPEKFGEQIDLAWQRQQRQRESELGVEQANPIE